VTPEALSAVHRRIAERRAYTARAPNAALDADTDMMVALASAVDSLTYANAQLRQVIDEMRGRRP